LKSLFLFSFVKHIHLGNIFIVMRENLERESERGNGSSGSNRENQNEGVPVQTKKCISFSFLDRTTTSFFFTNFSEEIKTTVLWSSFARFGNVMEVFIPKKLNKEGRRFGFVKFKDVTNPVALEAKLAEVWCGGRRLRVNLARFTRDSKEAMPEVKTAARRVVGSSSMVDKGNSFIQALGDGGGSEIGGEEVVPELEVLPGEEAFWRVAVLVFYTIQGRQRWYKLASLWRVLRALECLVWETTWCC
jgi:hypothetical protein